MTSIAQTARSRARAEMEAEILAAARRRLAAHGVEGLSLRAVARDVGVVSSAVYRYVASRDALLTTLIIESYDRLGEAVEAADAATGRGDFAGRFRAAGRATRVWALAEPHQWALIYGSPLPGYTAPQDTVPAATRAPLVLAAIVNDAAAAGAVAERPDRPDLREHLLLRDVLSPGVPDGLAVRALVAWTYLLGSVSAQLFGHRHNVVTDHGAAAVFEAEMDTIVDLVGLGP